ncbi:MAG TPA: hypothetical protein VJH03_14235 [Blastocatellia bacterium]|nr:hypothetical protein [Blastocatellia bacterium]
MKRLIGLSMLVVSLIAAAFAQGAASVVGSWDITIESPQGKRDAVLVIKQEGDKLTGAMRSPRGDRPLEKVTVNGSEIVFVMKAQIQGQDMEFTYKGTIAKDSMKGDADFGGFATGTWSAVPHKEGAAAPAATPAPAAAPAAGPNITGTWNATVEFSGGGGTPTFMLKQDGENLTGTYKGQLGEAPLKGTVKAGDVRFSFKLNFQGQEMEAVYTGKIQADGTMKGTVVLGELGEGNWTAKKQ